MASFTLPKNYSAPEGTKEGVEFSEIATFKIEGDKVMILTIGEDKSPVTGKDEKPKGGKEAIKEQLSAMEDKKGSAEMEDESAMEEESDEEEMD